MGPSSGFVVRKHVFLIYSQTLTLAEEDLENPEPETPHPDGEALNLRPAPRSPKLSPLKSSTPEPLYGSFRKLGVPYLEVLIIRILLFRVLY